MSTVDTRIVVLQFDNKQFESNVGTSLDTLEKLKNATNLEGSGKGLEKLGASVKSFSFGNLFEGLSTISDRFTNFGLVGMTAIQNITNKVVDLGAKLVTSIPSKIFGGGWTRASNIEKARHQIEGLSGSAQTAADIISGPVNNSVADTAYSLDQAAIAASALYTAGVKDLTKLEHVLKTISGTTAASMDGNYDQISSIITQMYSYGKLSALFANRLQFQGISIKDMLAEKYGTTVEDITEMIREGGISAEDTIELLNEKFADFAFKANDTFTGAAANIKSAFSKIGAEIFTPLINSENKAFNLIAVLNTIRIAINNVKKALMPVFSVWNDIVVITGKWFTGFLKRFEDASGVLKFSNSVKSMWDSFKENTTVGFVKKALGEVTDAIGNAEKKTDQSTAEIKDDLETIEELATRVIRGDFGNGKERIDNLHELGHSFVDIQNRVNELLGCSVRHTEAEDAEFIAAQRLAQGNKEVADTTEKVTNKTKEAVKETTKAKTKINGFTRVLDGIVSAIRVINKIVKAVKIGISPLLKSIKGLFTSLGRVVISILGLIGRLFTSLDKITEGLFVFKLFRAIQKALTPLENAFKGISKFLNKLADDINNFEGTKAENLYKLFERISNAISSFWTTAKSIAGKIVGGILHFLGFDSSKDKKEVDESTNMVETFIGFIDKFAGYVNEAIDTISEWVDSVHEFFKPFLDPAYEKFKEFVEFIKGLDINISSISNFFSSVGKVFAGIGLVLKKIFTSLINGEELDLKAYIDELTGGGFSEFVTTLKTKLIEFKDTFKKIFTEKDTNFISNILTKIKDFLSEKFPTADLSIIDNIVAFFNKVKELFSNSLSSLSESAGNVKGEVLEKIRGVFDKIAAFVNDFKDAFSDIDWGGLIKKVKNVITFISLIRYMWNWGTAIANMAKAFKKVGNALSNMEKASKWVAIAKAFSSLALVFLAIAGVVLVMSLIPADRAIFAVTSVELLIGLLAGVTVAIGKMEFDTKRVNSFSDMVIKLAASILILTITAKLLSMIDDEALTKGGASILGFVGLYLIAAKLASNASDASNTFLTMSRAILLLVPSIWLLSKMDDDRFINGGLKILAVLASLALVAKLLNGVSTKGVGTIVGLALSCLLLVPALKFLSTMDPGAVIAAATAIAIVMLSLAGATKMMGNSKNSFKSMIVAVIAMGAIGGALIILSAYDWASILSSAAAISIVMITMGIVAKKMSEVKFTKNRLAGIALLALSVGAIAGSLWLLSGFSWTSLLASAGAIVAIFVVLAVLAKQISKITFTKNRLLGIGVLVLAVVGIAASLWLLNGIDWKSMLVSAASIALVMLSLSLVTAALSKIKTVSPSVIITLISMLAGVGIILGVLTSLGADGGNTISLGLGIAIALTGIAIAVALLAAAATSLAPAAPVLLAFAGAAALLGLTVLMTGLGIYYVVDAFLALAEAGPKASESVIAAIEKFALGIIRITPIIALAIYGILDAIIRLAPKAYEAMAALGLAVAQAMYDVVPILALVAVEWVNGVLLGLLQKTSDFVLAGMEILIKFLNGFSAMFPVLVQAGIDAMVSFLNSLAYGIHANNTIILEAGRNVGLALTEGILIALNEFAGDVPLIGEKIKSALSNVQSALDERLPPQEAVESGKQYTSSYVKGAEEGAAEASGVGNTIFANLASAFSNGDGFSIGEGKVNEILSGMSGKDGEFINLGDLQNSNYLNEFLNGEGTETANLLNNDMLNGLSAGDYKIPGMENMDELLAGMKSKEGALGAEGTNIVEIIKRSLNVDTAPIGDNICNGLRDGMIRSEAKVAAQAARLGNIAKNSMAVGAEVFSPSRAGIRTGKFLGDGFVIGMAKRMRDVAVAGEELGRSAIDAISNPMAKVADIINSDMDVNPTITPVLDLSQIQNGTNSINSMFSNRSVALAGTASYAMGNMPTQESYADAIATKVNEAVTNAMNAINDADRKYEFEIPFYMNDREIARSVGTVMQSELDKLQKFNNRKAGIK